LLSNPLHQEYIACSNTLLKKTTCGTEKTTSAASMSTCTCTQHVYMRTPRSCYCMSTMNCNELLYWLSFMAGGTPCSGCQIARLPARQDAHCRFDLRGRSVATCGHLTNCRCVSCKPQHMSAVTTTCLHHNKHPPVGLCSPHVQQAFACMYRKSLILPEHCRFTSWSFL
jgi:hypothetical protein